MTTHRPPSTDRWMPGRARWPMVPEPGGQKAEVHVDRRSQRAAEVLRGQGRRRRSGPQRGGGEIFGVLGPNGAGKTTVVECVEGLCVPDAGTVRVAGLDPLRQRREVTRIVGVRLQQSESQAKLTVREALDLYRSFPPIRRTGADRRAARPRQRAEAAVRKAVGRLETAAVHRAGAGGTAADRRIRRADDGARPACPPGHVEHACAPTPGARLKGTALRTLGNQRTVPPGSAVTVPRVTARHQARRGPRSASRSR